MEQGDVARAASFDCDEPVLSEWIKKHAWSSHAGNSARVYVCLNPSGTGVAAYYSLSSGAALRTEAPGRIGKGMPVQIPIQLIGRLGVDRRFKGQHVGTDLVLDALNKILAISKMTAVRAVMVRSKPGSIDFYKKLQFEQSSSDPELFFFMVKDIRAAFDGAGIS